MKKIYVNIRKKSWKLKEKKIHKKKTIHTKIKTLVHWIKNTYLD